MGAIVLLLFCHAASLTNALVALACTVLELAPLSHQAHLNRTCSLSCVHPTLLLVCFRLEDLIFQVKALLD